MSPELFEPQLFELEKSRPTIRSDCYALGMVVYEALSGRRPFHKYGEFKIVSMVLKGIRPTRDARFADPLWEILQRCWRPHPNDRPNVEDVLWCLEGVAGLRKPPSSPVETAAAAEEDADDWSSTDDSSGMIPLFIPPGCFTISAYSVNTGTSPSVQGGSAPPREPRAAGGPTKATLVTPPPRRKPRPTTTRRPEKCSTCGVIGHRSKLTMAHSSFHLSVIFELQVVLAAVPSLRYKWWDV